jgi:nitrogen fixation protein FixH
MSGKQRIAPRGGGRGELTGRHVLLAFLAFFGVVFVVNGVFLAKALSTHTGVVAVEPYVKGLRYNSRIAAGERQAALGWVDAVEIGRDGGIELTIIDAEGRPVRGLAVAGTIGRPSTSRFDRHFVLTEAEPGRYRASVGTLERGTWLVTAEASVSGGGPEPVWRSRRRQWLKP